MSKKLNILVTGGAGFIGSHVVDAYINCGHNVTVIDNLITGQIGFVNKKADFIKMNITNPDISKIFKKKKFDIINHHAAQIDVRHSVDDPINDARTNIFGTINLLENARKFKCKKFIFISSGGVMYGECSNPKDETTKPQPLSPYGISKRAAEYYVKYFYYETYGLDFTIFRYANVYGPRQNLKGEAGVVSIFAQLMLKNKAVSIFGKGTQQRDYVNVKDVVNANLKALSLGSRNIINIGTQKTLNVNDLFKKLSKIIGYKKKPVYKPKRNGELDRSVLNISKAKRLLKWQPHVDINTGLKETVEYYKKIK